MNELVQDVEELRFLTRAAVEFRYPGEAADKDDAQRALAVAGAMRRLLLSLLEDAHG